MKKKLTLQINEIIKYKNIHKRYNLLMKIHIKSSTRKEYFLHMFRNCVLYDIFINNIILMPTTFEQNVLNHFIIKRIKAIGNSLKIFQICQKNRI